MVTSVPRRAETWDRYQHGAVWTFDRALMASVRCRRGRQRRTDRDPASRTTEPTTTPVGAMKAAAAQLGPRSERDSISNRRLESL
jgi:hypothetical protein